MFTSLIKSQVGELRASLRTGVRNASQNKTRAREEEGICSILVCGICPSNFDFDAVHEGRVVECAGSALHLCLLVRSCLVYCCRRAERYHFHRDELWRAHRNASATTKWPWWECGRRRPTTGNRSGLAPKRRHVHDRWWQYARWRGDSCR